MNVSGWHAIAFLTVSFIYCSVLSADTVQTRVVNNGVQGSMECMNTVVGVALYIKLLLEDFIAVFDLFETTSSQSIGRKVLERFALLSSKLNAIETMISKEDEYLIAQFNALSIGAVQDYDMRTQQVGQVGRTLDESQMSFVEQLAQLLVVSKVMVEQLSVQINSFQKRFSIIFNDCSADLYNTFVYENQQLITQYNTTASLLSGFITDFCEHLFNTQENLQVLFNIQGNQITRMLHNQNEYVIKLIKEFGRSLELQAARQITLIGTDLTVNTNAICSKLSGLELACTQQGDTVLLNEKFIEQAESFYEQSVEQALVRYNTQINRIMVRQFSRLLLGFTELASRFNVDLSLFENDLRARIVQQLSMSMQTLTGVSSTLQSKICFISADLGCKVRKSLSDTRLIFGKTASKTLSQIALLEEHVQIYTGDIKRQFACVDSQLRSTACKKVSDLELQQVMYAQAITDQLAAMYSGINQQSSLQLSSLEIELSRQNDQICTQLVNFDANLIALLARQFSNEQSSIASNKALLCSKINSIQVNTQADIKTKLSSFATNLAKQDYSLCAQLESAECDLIATSTTEFTSIFAQIALANAAYCSKIASIENNLASQTDNLCTQIMMFDASIMASIQSESDFLQSRIGEVITLINMNNNLLTVANQVFGAVAAGQVALPAQA